MDAVQFYETTIFNREHAGEAFRFISVPARSMPEGELPPFESAARTLGLQQPRRDRSQLLEPWTLPFLIDAALTPDPDFPYWFEYGPPFRGRRGPSQFAQHLAFAAEIPWEASPLSGKSLVALATTTGTTGIAIGMAAAETPTMLIWLPVGIVIGGPLLALGVVGFEATAYYLRRLLRLPNDDGADDEG